MILNKEQLTALQLPILVECYDHFLSSKRKRAIYNKVFSERQRATIGKYRRLAREWYLVKGYPESCKMSVNTKLILESAVNFFATGGGYER